MPFTSTSCCCRMCLNAMSIMGTAKRSERPRLARVQLPSIDIRRSIRSSTRLSEIPSSAKFCGIAGLKAVRTGANVAMIGETPYLDYRQEWRESLTPQFCPLRPGLASYLMLFRVILVMSCLQMVKGLQILCLVFAAAAICAAEDDAAWLFAAGQKAAHAGDSLQAYLLYSQAARLEPENALYARRQAELRSAAPLSRPAVLAPDPAIETVAALLQAEGIVESGVLAAEPPPVLKPAPGKRTFDLKETAQVLFEKVAGAYGIQVAMDAAYAPL